MRHELHLAVRGLRAAALVSLAAALVAGIAAGRLGAASAALGSLIVIANRSAAAATTAWARALTRKVATLGYLGWFVRMAFVLAALRVAAATSWIHRPALATAFCATLAVLLGAECVAYARGSYVPSWRLAR